MATVQNKAVRGTARVATAATLVALAASCTTGGAEERAAPQPTTTTTEVRLPSPTPYAPVEGEPAPEAKKLAADVIQRLGTYGIGEGTAEAATQRLSQAGTPVPVDPAAPILVPDAAAVVEIVYPQLGGLTDAEASVMVVFRQRLLEDGVERAVTRTADIRLSRPAGGAWAATAIASIGGNPVTPVAPTPAAEAVLRNERIDLPDSARWDIEAGRIDQKVLDLLARLAEQHELALTVLASGHPHNVFASGSVSNHTEGRGVDIWAVDGQPVVSMRAPGGPLESLVRQLLTEGVTELGSPWDLDGVGRGASFTNTVHQDHLHLAYDG